MYKDVWRYGCVVACIGGIDVNMFVSIVEECYYYVYYDFDVLYMTIYGLSYSTILFISFLYLLCFYSVVLSM